VYPTYRIYLRPSQSERNRITSGSKAPSKLSLSSSFSKLKRASISERPIRAVLNRNRKLDSIDRSDVGAQNLKYGVHREIIDNDIEHQKRKPAILRSIVK